MNKAGIVNHLAKVHAYRHYLELCTRTTGRQYAEIDRSLFAICKRLMYRCPGGLRDGIPIDYRSPDLDIAEALGAIKREHLTFDIALIDPFHEYGTSWRDLDEGFKLIGPGGALVVHDCLPPRRELVSPTYTEGDWCGVTYAAYIDFVSEHDDLDFYTVDTDYGCGVIKKRGGPSGRLGDTIARPWPRALGRAEVEKRDLLAAWRATANDGEARFDFFQQHQTALLKLISVDAFLAAERT